MSPNQQIRSDQDVKESSYSYRLLKTWVEIDLNSLRLNIRLLKPVEVGEQVVIEGWVESDKGRIIGTAARLTNEAGEVLARAEGKCVRIQSKEESGETRHRQED